MAPTRNMRFTIRQFMVVTAFAACLLALPRLFTDRELNLAAGLAALPAALVLLHLVVEQVLGAPCPVCSRWALRRLARHRQYYRCRACRARLKRYWFGPWLDASGPDDEARYRKPTNAGRWTGFTIPEQLEGTTSGHLLQNKRSGPQPAEKARRPVHQPEPSPRLDEARMRVRRFLDRLHEMKK